MWESKVAPLSGALFALLLIAGFLVNPSSDFMPPENDVVVYLQDGPTRIIIGAYLGLFAAAALIWFSASLHKSLRHLDDDAGRLSLLAFGGGLVASGLFAIGAMATIAGAERVLVTDSIQPGAAAALFDIAGIATGNGAPIGLGVMMIAAGLVSGRADSRYRWTTWVSLLVGLGLLSPFAWAVMALGVVWVAVVGVGMYRSENAGALVATG